MKLCLIIDLRILVVNCVFVIHWITLPSPFIFLSADSIFFTRGVDSSAVFLGSLRDLILNGSVGDGTSSCHVVQIYCIWALQEAKQVRAL